MLSGRPFELFRGLSNPSKAIRATLEVGDYVTCWGCARTAPSI